MEDYDYDGARSGLSLGAAIWPGPQPHRSIWENADDARWDQAFQDRSRPHGPDDDMQTSPHKQNVVKAEQIRWPLPLMSLDSRDIPGLYIENSGKPEPPDFNDRGVLLDRDMLKPPDRREPARARLPPIPPIRKMPKGPQLRKGRKRFALPLLVARPSGAVTEVMACPDSGSDENIISLELVTSLGLKTEQTSSGEPRQFTVANGNIVTAVGQVSTKCRFAVGTPSSITSLECVFHVFNTLAVPLIMGVNFLQQTETLSKHRDRLVEHSFPVMQALRVNSVGRPKRSLICQLDTYVGCATVDTGSDLDLVSPKFANSRDFMIEPAFEQVEFADCSIGCTSGVIRTLFTVGNVNSLGFHPRGESIDLDLFVLDNLNADILVGQDTADMLDVFNLHHESLIPSIPRLGESELNIIRHIGRFEQGVLGLWKKVRKAMGAISQAVPMAWLGLRPKLMLSNEKMLGGSVSELGLRNYPAQKGNEHKSLKTWSSRLLKAEDKCAPQLPFTVQHRPPPQRLIFQRP
ncbi:hypothetical protein CDV31_012418 [Fusarium ambrosium]|uniref:Uncharacterized protein n=1 Tax=Fusarium ambrosium TaxID=131363 RepID=A0A428TA50_9HYPO|nr:hypothetical protein CDV31_012418 [Fusarium ambrosium]